MKKWIAWIGCLLLMNGAWAQPGENRISVEDIRFDRHGEQVDISFRLQTDRKTARRGFARLVIPVLTDGVNREILPAIVIRDRRAETAYLRHARNSGEMPADGLLVIRSGRSGDYKATAALQEWMTGSDLIFESLEVGCCGRSGDEPERIASQLMLPRETYVTERVSVAAPERSTAEILAGKFPFIIAVEREHPAVTLLKEGEFTALEHGELVRIIEDDRESSLTIYFPQGSHTIDARFSGNNEALVQLISSVREIEESEDCRVIRVIIAGYASPEGSYEFNEGLARRRAQEVRRFLLEKSPIAAEKITIYNGAEDWRGLRTLVEASALEEKELVLHIIDHAPLMSPDGRQKVRLQQLKDINRGRTYQYLFDHFFPKLRNAAYIRIYYENK